MTATTTRVIDTITVIYRVKATRHGVDYIRPEAREFLDFARAAEFALRMIAGGRYIGMTGGELMEGNSRHL